jgi:hypothetical protein
MSRRQVAIALVAVVAIYELAALVINGFSPGPGGATSSAYATSVDGLAAYFDLLRQTGHRAVELTGSTARARLRPAETVVMLDPGILTESDLRNVASFVQAGGRLVAGGQNPGRWISALDHNPPTWTAAGAPFSYSTLNGVASVRSVGRGSFVKLGDDEAVVAAGATALVARFSLGAGNVYLLADTSPLQNAYIDQAENAALGEALAGAPGTPVAFLEGIHGYGNATGLAALPDRWKWVVVLLALAAFTFVASRFRRLGDAEPELEAPLPPRRAHVDALALALQRTGQPVAAIAQSRERSGAAR